MKKLIAVAILALGIIAIAPRLQHGPFPPPPPPCPGPYCGGH